MLPRRKSKRKQKAARQQSQLQARISQLAPGAAGEGRRRKRPQLRIVNLSADSNDEVIAETEAYVLVGVVKE
jgi:hypothetical protein